MPFKEVPNNPDLVYVPKKAFEAVKVLAKTGIKVGEIQESLSQVKQENNSLKMENKSLQSELIVERASNKDLEKGNTSLKEENESLKRELENWKEYSQKVIDTLARFFEEKLNGSKIAKIIFTSAEAFKKKFFEQKEEKVSTLEKKPLEQKIERSKGKDLELER